MAISFAYFAPILGFLLVFIISYAILSRAKILGGNKFIHIFVSFLVSVFFVASPALIEVTRLSVPWVAILLVVLFCMLLIIAFVGNLDSFLKSKLIAAVVIIAILIIFLISAANVFAPIIKPYIPGAAEAGGISQLLQIKHIIFSEAFLGMIVLFIVAAIASWILTKK